MLFDDILDQDCDGFQLLVIQVLQIVHQLVEPGGIFSIHAVKSVKARYEEIGLFMVIPYHPAVRPVEVPDGFDGTFHPPLDNVPKRYAIVRSNRYMVENSDAIICYVNRPGNTRELPKYAGRQKMNQLEYSINLADKRKWT